MVTRFGAVLRAAPPRATPWVWSLVLAILLLGPALKPGYVLTYDMVWVPDLALRSDFLGLGSGLPRAVPSDLVVALADEVLGAMLLQKAMLVATLTLAGVGAWKLVGGDNWISQSAAGTFYLWSPFMVERLGIGHWPLLMTYAALPWIVRTAGKWTAGERALPQLVLWMTFSSLSPVGGVIAAIAALLGVVGAPGRTRRALWVAAMVAGLNAPWIVAGVMHGSGALSDAAGVDAFAAQSVGSLPLPLTLIGLGGIWNSEVVPASRLLWPGVAMTVLMLVVCASGLRPWRQQFSKHLQFSMLGAAVVGLVVGLVGAWVPESLAWMVSNIPGAGLLRDGWRFVALVAPLSATLFGLGVGRLSAWMRNRVLSLVVGVGLILAPVSLMPDAALGLSGELRAVSYPQEYAEAREALVERQGLGHDGDLLVLPFTTYRRPTWNGRRRTLDPLGRYFPVNYLAADTLVVSGVTIPGEDERARRVATDLSTLQGSQLLGELRREGIRWVVLDLEAERDLAGTGLPAYAQRLDPANLIVEGDRLVLWELPEGNDAHTAGPEPAALIILGLAWAISGLIAAGAVVAVGRRPRRVVQSLQMRRRT